jgi:lysine 2,3-aminomutase
MELKRREEMIVSDDEPPSLAPPAAEAEAACTSAKPPAAARQWDDWQWQMRNRIRTIDQLRALLPGLEGADALKAVAARYPLAITPYYASLIQSADPSDPVFQLCVPQVDELYNPPFLRDDPLEENEDMPVPGLVHRYPDRALLIATTTCAMYCRHCTRKRVAGTRETAISAERLRQVVRYLRRHPEVTDVIVSGGDPFTMNDAAIERILVALRSVSSVEIIRFGTRTPVTLPMRVTEQLAAILKRYHPVFVNTHFNHPNEVTAEAAEACAHLVDAGVPMGNQAVLLRGINDDPRTIEQLCRTLVRIRVRPYYLYQCDLVRGVEHLRTPLSRGLEIAEYLRGRLSGLAIPTFVVDAPHGGGKIPLTPNYIVSTSPTHTVLRNFEGLLVGYPDPEGVRYSAAGKTPVADLGGVWELAAGRRSAIIPEANARHQRRHGCAATIDDEQA